MANSASSNPIVIDTFTAVDIISTSNDFHVYKIALVSGSTADITTIKNANGVVIWEHVGDAANYTTETNFPGRGFLFNGLQVTALGSGTVYLYTYEHPPVDGS